MIQLRLRSSSMRVNIASASPIIRARPRCASGKRPHKIAIKMILSIPSTISSPVSVARLIHASGEAHEHSASSGKASFGGTLVQIAVLDIIFSLDSVITAVGMAQHLPVMILAVIIAVGVMMLASGAIARFVDANPTIKILALAFLILVGVSLIADGLGFHIPKGYIYFSMAFSLLVELINIQIRKKSAAK